MRRICFREEWSRGARKGEESIFFWLGKDLEIAGKGEGSRYTFFVGLRDVGKVEREAQIQETKSLRSGVQFLVVGAQY